VKRGARLRRATFGGSGNLMRHFPGGDRNPVRALLALRTHHLRIMPHSRAKRPRVRRDRGFMRRIFRRMHCDAGHQQQSPCRQ